jgi:hypothetical protein
VKEKNMDLEIQAAEGNLSDFAFAAELRLRADLLLWRGRQPAHLPPL